VYLPVCVDALGTMVLHTNRRIVMTALRRRRLEDLRLRGLAPKTQQCSVAAVHQLAPHDRRAPDQIREEEIRQYFLFLLPEKGGAESTFRLHLEGIRFFYERPLKRPWPVVELMRPRKPPKQPVVLSASEVRSLLALVEPPKAQMCLRLVDACGLRLTAGTPLQVADIDAQRMLVRVRQGTGGKDRLVPLALQVLEWCTPPSPPAWPISKNTGVLSCRRWRTCCGAMAPPIWNGSARGSRPAIVAPWTI
jgi:integrase/recombinase XerD